MKLFVFLIVSFQLSVSCKSRRDGESIGAGSSVKEFQVENTVDANGLTMRVYRIGKRPQRVRFFFANEDATKGLLGSGPQYNKVVKDPYQTQSTSSNAGLFSLLSIPTAIGGNVSEISEKSGTYGLAVNPYLMGCFVDQLRQIKRVGEEFPEFFAKFQIDEINIYIKPIASVDHFVPRDRRFHVTPVTIMPKDPAIHVVVPFAVLNNGRQPECMLDKDDELAKAFKFAMAGRE